MIRYFIYNFVTAIGGLLSVPFFLLKERGRRRIWERLGFWNLKAENLTWFHAASLGEVNGILPFIKKWKSLNPECEILLTSVSPTGLDAAKDQVDHVRLLPFDSTPYYALALNGLNFRNLIVAETELWPELFRFVQSRGVQISIINGRISDYTFKTYNALRFLFAPVLSKVAPICVVSSRARERFVALGARSETVLLTGHTKYDKPKSVATDEQAFKLKKSFFAEDIPVLTLGSLRPEEGERWFSALIKANFDELDVGLIVAPRHKEKFSYFEQELQELGYPFIKWSEQKNSDKSLESESRIVLLDTYGDLESCYSFSDVSFIGGTLIDIGGHNPLEAAAYGSSLLMGPHVSVVQEIADELYAAGGLRFVDSTNDLTEILNELNSNSSEFKVRGRAAKLVWERCRGALLKSIEALGAGNGRKNEAAA